MSAVIAWLRQGRQKLLTAWFVLRDARTPRRVRLLILAMMAYAISPVDAVPDIAPVLGYLDDLVLVPLGLGLALRLSPGEVLAAAEAQAGKVRGGVIVAGIALFLALWIGLIWLLFQYIFSRH